jgi:hypothetical protein
MKKVVIPAKAGIQATPPFPTWGKGGGVFFVHSRYWPLYIKAPISKIPFVNVPPSFIKGRGLGGWIKISSLYEVFFQYGIFICILPVTPHPYRF